MMWLTWRQFRAHALVAGVTLALLAAYLVWLGLRIRHSYEINVECGVGCSVETARGILERSYSTSLQVAGLMVILAPALIGAFWGAPLIAREFETGTHRFIWSQSITRTRWLAVKLLFTTLVGVAVTGALSVMLTWAASPYDALIDQRFQPLFFPTRNVAPLGYAAFAVVAGTAIGLLARRTVLAMAITLAAFALLQIVVPTVIRPHLQPVVTESVTLDPTASFDALGVGPQGVHIHGYSLPGAWGPLRGRPAARRRRQPPHPAAGRAVPTGQPGRGPGLPRRAGCALRGLVPAGRPLLDLPVAGVRGVPGARRGAGRVHLLAHPPHRLAGHVTRGAGPTGGGRSGQRHAHACSRGSDRAQTSTSTACSRSGVRGSRLNGHDRPAQRLPDPNPTQGRYRPGAGTPWRAQSARLRGYGPCQGPRSAKPRLSSSMP